MSKKIIGEIRLQLPAGSANPAPPVGPALGAQGVNIMGFCKEFNAKGSGVPNRDKVGTVTRKQVLEIVDIKRKDLNANDDDQAFHIIAGTARSMGLEIAD